MHLNYWLNRIRNAHKDDTIEDIFHHLLENNSPATFNEEVIYCYSLKSNNK